MEPLDDELRKLGARGRLESPPPIDVRGRVQETLFVSTATPRIGATPIAFVGAAAAAAAAATWIARPAYEAIFGPWLTYWLF